MKPILQIKILLLKQQINLRENEVNSLRFKDNAREIAISETLREMWYINTCNIADRYLEYLQDQNQLPDKKNTIFQRRK